MFPLVDTSSSSFYSRFKNGHPTRVSIFRLYIDDLNIQGFDFTKEIKCRVFHKFEKLNNLSINIFELRFYQDGNKWKRKIIPIQITKNDSNKVFDLMLSKNHYVLNKRLPVFLGKHDSKFICRRCLSSY